MNWIIDFFQSLGDFIVNAIRATLTGVVSLVKALFTITEFFSIAQEVMSYLPQNFLAFALIGLTVTVIYLVLGWGRS